MSVARANLIVVLFLLACDAERGGGPRAQAALGGEVVALVEGEAITRTELALAAREHGGDTRRTLDALEAEHLLLAEARRAGMSGSGGRDRRRALAQRMLFELEARVPASRVREEDVARAYTEREASLSRPERRVVRHLLVQPSDQVDLASNEAAEGFAREALARLVEEGASQEAMSALARSAEGRGGFVVRVEALPPLERAAPIEPAFVEAVYGVERVGLVEQLVRTRFGFHVIHVVRIDPARIVSREEGEAIVREALLAELRRRELERTIDALGARSRVVVDAQALSRTLANDALFRTDP